MLPVRVRDTAAALAAAATPVAVNKVRVEADALRGMLAKALELAGDNPPELVRLKRQAEELALNAMLKLGSMVPAPAAEGRPAGGSKLPTVGGFAEEVGLSRSAAQRLRELHEAMQSDGEEFSRLVTEALDQGKPVPLTKLYALGRYGHTPEPKSHTWLGTAVSSAIQTRSMFMDIEKNTEAPPDVRSAARAYLKATNPRGLSVDLPSVV